MRHVINKIDRNKSILFCLRIIVKLNFTSLICAHLVLSNHSDDVIHCSPWSRYAEGSLVSSSKAIGINHDVYIFRYNEKNIPR